MPEVTNDPPPAIVAPDTTTNSTATSYATSSDLATAPLTDTTVELVGVAPAPTA